MIAYAGGQLFFIYMTNFALNDYIKGLFASMETSGDTSGNWLQLEKNTFDDLINRSKIDKNIKFSDLSDRETYDKVADAYIKDIMNTFKIPTVEDAALWSWRPGWYQKRKGKVTNIPITTPGVFGKTAREVMSNRQKAVKAYIENQKIE